MYSALRKEALPCFIIFLTLFILTFLSPSVSPILIMTLYLLESSRWGTLILTKFPKGQLIKFYTMGCALVFGFLLHLII